MLVVMLPQHNIYRKINLDLGINNQLLIFLKLFDKKHYFSHQATYVPTQ